MIFLVLLAGVQPWKTETFKYERWSADKQSFMYLAGVMGNLVFLAGALVCYYTGILPSSWLTFDGIVFIVYCSGLIIASNLLPVWILDGGRFVNIYHTGRESKHSRKHLFTSEEARAYWYAVYCILLMTGTALSVLMLPIL